MIHYGEGRCINEDNEEIIQRFYQELWNAWELPMADEILTEDVRFVIEYYPRDIHRQIVHFLDRGRCDRRAARISFPRHHVHAMVDLDLQGDKPWPR
jgi:hypothetical protein